jgi:tol-pal system protein YbgF
MTTARRSPLPALLLVPLLAAGCASGGGLTGQRQSAAADPGLTELKTRVLELQRKAAVQEVELTRMRERIAELEARLGITASRRPPPAAAVEPRPVEETPATSVGALGRVPEPVPPPRPAPRPEIEESEIAEPDLPMAAAPPPTPSTAPRAAAPTAAPAQSAQPLTPDAQGLYDRGYTLLHQGRLVDAESTFQRFLQQYPGTDLADNAQYWIGEARYGRDDLRGALAAFRETVARYPTGNKVPDAMLKAGQCLERLDDLDGARVTYREVIDRFGGSAASAVAEERLERLP